MAGLIIAVLPSAAVLPTSAAAAPIHNVAGRDQTRASATSRSPAKAAPPKPAAPGTPNDGVVLSGVTCVNSSDCWAVGYVWSTGGITQTAIEQYNGSAWSLVPSPNPNPFNAVLSAVSCVSATSCWAVGSGGGTLMEQYNGSSWTIITSPNPPDSPTLYGVACVTASECWAVGYYYHPNDDLTLIEEYNGSAWSIISSPSPGLYGNSLGGVTCTSASNCWAVGYYDSGNGWPPLFEQYNGTAWSVVSAGYGNLYNQLNGVTCVSASDCWAVGYDSVGDGTNITDVYQYNGSEWSLVHTPNVGVSQEDLLFGVTCTSASACWAVGNYENTNGSLEQTLVEQYNGSAWSVVSSPNAGALNNLVAVSCSSATDCWAVGSYGGISGRGQELFEHYTGGVWSVTVTQQPPAGGPVLAAEVRGGSNCACANADLGQSHSGDPVDTAYGGFSESYTDLTIPGRGMPLQFSRTYDSGAAVIATAPGPLGYGWTSNVFASLSPPSGQGPVTITQEGGAQVVFTQNGSTYAPAAPRVIATLIHNGDGTWTFVRKAQNTYTFSATGQLLSEKDLNGYTTSFTYNGGNQLTKITDSAARTLTIGWTGSSITTVTDPNASPVRSVTFQYNDGHGNLTDVLDVDGGRTHFAYDPSHRLTNMYDPNCYTAGASCDGGNGVLNGYDSQNRVTSQKDQLGRPTTFLYNGDPSSSSGGTTTTTDPKGNVTFDTYQYGLLTAQTKGYGTSAAATWQYTYDATTVALVSQTDPDGHMTSYTVDAMGNRLATSAPLDRYSSSTYNSFNEPLTQTDSLNVTTTSTYDGNGNLTSVSSPLLNSSGQVIATATTTYNHTDTSHPGDVTSMVDPDTKTSSYGYDSYGDRVETKDPLGNVTASVFNADGWLTASYTPKAGCTWAALPPAGCSVNYQTTYSYTIPNTTTTDEFGDVQTVTDPIAHVTTHGYDADRNVTTLKDGTGNLTTYVYDLANQETQVKRADSPRTTVTTDYNLDGTVLDQKDGKGNAIQTYGYNSLAQVTSVKDALGNETDFTYDSAGNQLTKQNPGGNCSTASKCTTSAYDAANELTSVTYSDGVTPNVTAILYDADGQKTAWSDGSGAWTQVFDSLHRLTSVTEGASGTVAYGYNLRNLPTTITYPGGVHSVTETYDDAGRWTKVQDWNGNLTTIGYDVNSNLTSYTLPTATTVIDTMIYNKADQLTSITDKAGATAFYAASYTDNAANQLITDTSAPVAQAKFHYTALNQLCYAGSANSTSCPSAPTGSEPFAYDAADNLIKLNTTTQQFNAADELCWTVSGSSSNACTTPPTGATGYTYDTNGNRTAKTPSAGAATCDSYDQANRLIKVTTGTGASCTSPTTLGTYSYNGSGLRMGKTVAGVSTTEAWDPTASVPLLLEDKTSSATVDYVFGPGGLPLEQIGTATLWYHHDQLGSTRALTNASGVTQATDQYDPYGNLIASTGTVTNPFLYSGQYKDSESGLYYLRARYYDSAAAQFLTRDIAIGATRSPYAYVGGSPLNATDPSGLCGLDFFQACDPRCSDSVQPLGPWQCSAAVGAVKVAKGVAASGVCSEFVANKFGTSNPFGVVGFQKCWVHSDKGSAILTTTYSGEGPVGAGGGPSFFVGNTDNLCAYGGAFDTNVVNGDVYFGLTVAHSRGGAVESFTIGVSAGPPGGWLGTTNTTVQWLSRSG
jgi:RHS repeat-associated protein